MADEAPGYIDYRFYTSFKRLMYMGQWTPDMLSKPSHKKFFYTFYVFCLIMMVVLIINQVLDLYLVLGNFRKMTFNFCSSTIVVGIFGKMLLLYDRKDTLKSLQINLFEDSMKYNNAEDTAILDAAFKKFICIRKIFYAGPVIVIPLWGIASYFSYKWGPRLLPFAGYFPMNLNDDVTYLPALIYEIIMAFYVVQTVLESDLTMLGIVLQIEAHYEILSKNLIKLTQAHEGHECNATENYCKREINKCLMNEKMLEKLKAIVKRHLELLSYCEGVEYVFNRCMAIQLFGGSFLILMIGVEATRRMHNITVSLGYQMMYLIFVMIDIYVICYHFTTLANEGTNLGRAAYGSGWYRMNVKIQRIICLLINRTQKPPKFTYGKLFVIDVNAYMHLIKNIYSWLMLLRQLEMK